MAHDSPAPSRGQSGGPTGPAPTTPRTGGAGAVAEDPERHSGVEQEWTVELDQQPGYNWVDIEYWRQDPSTPGELEIDSSQIKTNLGARLAIIADTPLANRARCAQVTEWRDSIRFSELHEGSQLCGKSRVDRYAALQVKVLPTSSASNGRFIFHGITWY